MGEVLSYSVLASDYDGTLAVDGRVPSETLDALARFREAAGHLILVTGRDIADLSTVFPHMSLFDCIVAENGALMYEPTTGAETLLAPPPPPQFVARLQARGVTPLLHGRVIVSTRQPYEAEVRETISDLGLPFHVIFNKGAVMALPRGVNKGTGLRAALARLDASRESVVGVGDAENDHSLFANVGLAAAVANALPSLQDEADVLLEKPATAGVTELLERILSGDPDLVRRRPTVAEPIPEPLAAAEERAPAAE